MIKSSMKTVSMAAAITAGLLFGGAVQAQTSSTGVGGNSASGTGNTPPGTSKPTDNAITPSPTAGTGSGSSSGMSGGSSGMSGMSGMSGSGTGSAGGNTASGTGNTPPGTSKPQNNAVTPAPTAGTGFTGSSGMSGSGMSGSGMSGSSTTGMGSSDSNLPPGTSKQQNNSATPAPTAGNSAKSSKGQGMDKRMEADARKARKSSMRKGDMNNSAGSTTPGSDMTTPAR